MTDYLTEQEQIQLLKDWLKRYGPTIILGIVIAFIITISWRYYQNHRYKVLSQASFIYDDMLAARTQNKDKQTSDLAITLITKYANTPYAHMSALTLARTAVLNKDYASAIKQLDWVMSKASDVAIRQIARLRKARILVEQNQAQAALNLLSTVDDKTFAGMIDEVKGDAYLALNDKSNARKYYQQGVQELPNAEALRPILQMKLDNLAE